MKYLKKFLYNEGEGRKIMETILKIEDIEKYYGNRSNLTKAIDGISLEVEHGEFVAIMGASGSGKTTLLNVISTIDRVTSGHIYVGGVDITTLKGNDLNRFRREELGFIFQDFNLLDTLTAYENIALALSIQNVKPKEIDVRVRSIAQKLGISKVLSRTTFLGALFLVIIAGLPILVSNFSELPTSVTVGGTGLLIVVGVALETYNQIESTLSARKYERGYRR